MKYDDIVYEYNLKKKKGYRKYIPYFFEQRRYDLYLSQLDREEDDRRIIERYRTEMQYI